MHSRFDREIWPFSPTVLRVAQLLTGQRADAEDLAQETLLRAYRALASFDGKNPRGWLLTILRNVRTDRLRSKPKGLALELGDDLAAPAPAAEVQWDDPASMLERFSDQQLIDALLKLPEDIRWALLLVDVEDLDGETAAEVMQVPPGTVKSRLHRGRQMLRRLLDERASEVTK